ncbi:hypothetical protein [Streptomyces sp. NPDC048638]|uniref:hypothetical protein n=1 Tax=Streptomyces sp. NPDC048638 TaxID=3365580 RepID=UPI003715FBD7
MSFTSAVASIFGLNKPVITKAEQIVVADVAVQAGRKHRNHKAVAAAVAEFYLVERHRQHARRYSWRYNSAEREFLDERHATALEGIVDAGIGVDEFEAIYRELFATNR